MHDDSHNAAARLVTAVGCRCCCCAAAAAVDVLLLPPPPPPPLLLLLKLLLKLLLELRPSCNAPCDQHETLRCPPCHMAVPYG
eukprot:SAG11_NODE_772_length_7254_cov_1.857582_11_plen_83_part_00